MVTKSTISDQKPQIIVGTLRVKTESQFTENFKIDL